jgi:hypothetical protein
LAPVMSPRARNVLRVAAVNGLVLISLLIAVNVFSAIVLVISPAQSVRDATENLAPARLPNYRDDRDRAEAIFRDTQNIRSEIYAPFVEWTRSSYSGETTHVDSRGDRVVPRPRGAGESGPTVRFFGGSTMWGIGADDAGTIPGIFQRRHPGFKVLNHGQIGHNSRQGLERLENILALGGRLDTAVFYQGYNDAQSLCRSETSLNGHGAEARMRILLGDLDRRVVLDSSPSLAEAIRTILIGRTEDLVRKIRAKQPDELPEHPSDPDAYDCFRSRGRAEHVAETVVTVWRMARRLVRDAGGRFIVVLHPVATEGHPRLDHLGRRTLKANRGSDNQSNAVYPILRRAARRLPWVYDFTSAFDTDDYIYIDKTHVSRKGNEIVARLIDRVLADPASMR